MNTKLLKKEGNSTEDPLKKLVACLKPIAKSSDDPRFAKLISLIDEIKADTPQKAHYLAGSCVVLIISLEEELGLNLAKHKSFEKFCTKIEPNEVYGSPEVKARLLPRKKPHTPRPQTSLTR